MTDLETDSPWGPPSVLPSASTLGPSYPDVTGDVPAPPHDDDDDTEIDAGEVLRKEELVKSAIPRAESCRVGAGGLS